jgi:predicted lipoprotein
MRGYRSLTVAAVTGLFVGCVPWTVRPIGESEERGKGPFDAAAYVDSIWQGKVLPAAAEARDLATAPRRSGPCLVKGRGRVARVDTASRTGLAFVELDGGGSAVLQIGPAIRGTVLRDALPFIQFSQFTNQLEFARVGNALNQRAARLLAQLDERHLQGADVGFSGAAAWEDGQVPEVVPVTLVVAQRGNL